MEITEHIAALAAEGTRLADLAGRTDLDAHVPTCPDWRLRDLVLHTGRAHLWATAYVQGRRTPLAEAETAELWGPEPSDAELADWYRASHGRLVSALEQAPDDLECWSFLPAPSPRAFWARRQAHETAIHRVDAEGAAGGEGDGHGTALAVDGIEELLGMLADPRFPLRSEQPRTLLVRPTDVELPWLVTISREPLVTVRQDAAADCTVSGTAEELYRWLWNRLPLDRIAVSGDRTLVELWREAAQVRWN